MNTPPSECKTVPAFSSGDRLFQRYTLKERLGAGAFGIVWLAQPVFVEDGESENVALKILPKLATERDVVKDIQHELRNGRRLAHKNIVRVHDMFVDDAAAAISMEYVDGDTLLGLRLERPNGVFECNDLLPYLGQLCKALTYAHQDAGVVHRDLKPSNIMVSSKGIVKITDFGISMVISETANRITQCGFGSGTLPYMSPEQITDDGADSLLDVYSLGATCYDLLTGKPPFYKGDVRYQIMSKVPPTMASRRADLQVTGEPIPKHWEDTISLCLKKDPNDRLRNVEEFYERLTAGPKVKPIKPKPKENGDPEPEPKGGKTERDMVKLLGWLFAVTAVMALMVGILMTLVFIGPRSKAPLQTPAPVSVSTPTPPPQTPNSSANSPSIIAPRASSHSDRDSATRPPPCPDARSDSCPNACSDSYPNACSADKLSDGFAKYCQSHCAIHQQPRRRRE